MLALSFTNYTKKGMDFSERWCHSLEENGIIIFKIILSITSLVK